MIQFTTIDNEQRTFVIFGKGWSNFKMICNIDDLVKCCQSIDKNSPYKIYHIWNSKLQPCSRKYLAEMMASNGRPQDVEFFTKLGAATY